MEAIKQWALQAALALALGGLLHRTIPEGSTAKTVSFCISCCILALLLSPFLQTASQLTKGIDTVFRSSSSDSAAQMCSLSETFISDTTEIQLENALEDNLFHSLGISSFIQVTCHNYELTELTVTLLKSEEKYQDKVRVLLEQMVGTEVKIHVVTKQDSS